MKPITVAKIHTIVKTWDAAVFYQTEYVLDAVNRCKLLFWAYAII